MLKHIVLFQWQPEASEEQITAAMTALQEMTPQIPFIVDLSAGKNFSDRSQGYTHALTVTFNQTSDLALYQPHPVHQEIVVNLIRPIALKILAIDYEY
ncbi:MAG: Dabb family protein [Synechococcaceae cyanobacterium RL_1_2]|nr:Dabb family protein [Synechococcaceae cyanobacterium RL_1_2]